MPKRLEVPQILRSHCEMISMPPPTQAPWIMATMGWRQPAIASMVVSSCSPYFLATFELLRVFSNSETSAPEAKACPPAPRSTTQRSALSASSSRIVSPRRFHMARLSAFSRSGLLRVTVAMSPLRPRRISPDMSCSLGCRLDESATHPGDCAGDDRPEEEHQRERGDRADQAVGPEHAQVACRSDHRQAEGILGAVAEDQRQRKRRERNRNLLEHVADHAEDEHQPDVEHGVLDGVGADRARHHDHRRDGG